MINKDGPLDGKVEAVLITTMSGDELVKVAHGVYLTVDQFASIRPVGDDPEYLASLKALRMQVVEERLAAASARSDTAMKQREVTEVTGQLGTAQRELAEMTRRYRLAEAALKYVHLLDAVGPLKPLPVLDMLLSTKDKQGSLAMPCREDLVINGRYPGCSCEEPCVIQVVSLPCALPNPHNYAVGPHRTLDGREFETGETRWTDDEA